MALIAILGVITFVTLAMVVVTTFNGWVLATLWGWFMVPTFGLPLLTIPQAIGVSFVVAMFKTYEYKDHEDKTKAAKTLAGGMLGKLILLGIAWCLKEWFF